MPIYKLSEAILILFAYNFCLGILSSMMVISPGTKPEGIQYYPGMHGNQEIIHEVNIEDEEIENLENNEIEEVIEPIDDTTECEKSDENDQFESEETYDNTEYDDGLFYEGFDSSFKAYMDYRCITDTSSVQYEMQQQAYTDERGFRRIGDDYCVALGTGITDGCGERFLITLDSGYSFTAIVADVKSDAHTDATNCYVPRGDNSGNVVEFIIDTDCAESSMLSSGNAGYYDDLSGNIISVGSI